MKPEDKELLLKDLCARLPYNVIVHIHDLDVVDYDNYLCEDTLAKMRANQITLKPYLRPLSSMTEEEKDEYSNTFDVTSSDVDDYDIFNVKAVDWLIGHMFDVRDLIPKSLAIEVTEENNPYNKQEE